MVIIPSIFTLGLLLAYLNLGKNMSLSLGLIIAFIVASAVMVKHEMSKQS